MSGPLESQTKLIGDDPRYERYRWQVFFITWLAYAGFYLTRKSFAVAKIELADPAVLGMTKVQLAWIDGAYLTTYAIGQFVWGICGDRFGTRKVILAGMLCSVVTAVAMGASSLVVVLGVLFCIQGLCQSTGWAPLAKNVGNFFSQRERGRVMGLWCTNYALGGFLATTVAGLAADYLGWRYAFWVPAALLLGVWVLFVALQKNRPEDVGLPPIERYHGEREAVLVETEAPSDEPDQSWKVIREVFATRMVWLLGLVYFLLKPTRYLVLFWSPVYINERLGTGAASSGILGSMFELAGPVSVLFGGYMSDKVFGSRRMPMSVISTLGVAVLLLFFDDLPDTRLALGLGFFGIGFLLYIPDSLVSGTAAIDFGTKNGASTASGIINGCGSIGAIAGGTMPGWIERVVGPEVDIWSGIFVGLSISLFIAAGLLLPRWNAVPTVAEGSETPKPKETQ
jgi:OPA family glycerol-3-phosphate transporter-like MFS transporter